MYLSHYDYYTDSSTNGKSHSALYPFNGTYQALSSTINYGPNWPDWKLRISKGLDATTSLTASVQRIITAKEGYYQAEMSQSPITGPSTTYEAQKDFGIGFLGVVMPVCPAFTVLAPISTKTAENRALARYNAKVAEVNRQFQGGVFLGEIAETLHGIRHPAEALFKGLESYSSAAKKLRQRYVKSKADFLALKKTQRRKVAKSFAEAAGGLWLERSFHWLPLLGDIKGAVNALYATLDQDTSRMVRASYTDEASRTTQRGSFSGPIIYNCERTQVDRTGATVKFYGKVRVGARNPGSPDLKALGFDPRSFAPTIWELIPYSWAVDYFTNIGDIIYGWAYAGTDVSWTVRGSKVFAQRTQSAGLLGAWSAPAPGYKFTKINGFMLMPVVAGETANLSRASYVGSLIPDLDIKIPGLSLKWLNLGAVFLQRSLAFL
jgi:hypothetical protein